MSFMNAKVTLVLKVQFPKHLYLSNDCLLIKHLLRRKTFFGHCYWLKCVCSKLFHLLQICLMVEVHQLVQ